MNDSSLFFIIYPVILGEMVVFSVALHVFSSHNLLIFHAVIKKLGAFSNKLHTFSEKKG